MKIKSNTWQTIKIIVINWTLFILIAETYFVWQSYNKVKDFSQEANGWKQKFETCQANFGEMERQVSSGRIVLDFEKETK